MRSIKKIIIYLIISLVILLGLTVVDYIFVKSKNTFPRIAIKEENKDLLICLLEKILELKIKEIKYLNLERNVLNVHVKRKHFDLFLDTDIGKIQVEINSYYSDYIPVRNTSYICNTYTSYTSRGDKYDPNINIIQINFSYGLKKDKLFSRYYIQDEDGNKYVSNFLIIELNMDKYMEFWYNKDEKEINEYIEYIMLDLGEKDLKNVSKGNGVVKKYMEELVKVNEDADFLNFISVEKDNMMIENSIRDEATKKGIKQGLERGTEQSKNEIAKNMLKKGLDISLISEVTGLSNEQINNLK